MVSIVPYASFSLRSDDGNVNDSLSIFGCLIHTLAVGMTLMALTNSEMKRRRTTDKIRLSFYSWLFENDKESNTGIQRLRIPTKVLELEGRLIGKEKNEDEADGVCRELVDPSTALTSNMNVVVLSIPSKQELSEIKSCGVEFYYVIQGDGKLYRDGEALDVGKGDGFVVDPGW